MAVTAAGCLVIGVGNPDRADDGVGRLVARRLRDVVSGDVRVDEQDGAVAALIESMGGAASVFLIDAAMSGAPPGTVHRIDCATSQPLPRTAAASSHGLGVAEAIGLARALGCLPRRCVVYAVEGVTFAAGEGMSPAVLAAVDAVVARLAEELRSV